MTLALFFFFFTNSAVLILFRWHWRSFVIGGGSAFWVLAYGLFYWASRLKLDSLSAVVLYLGYLFLIAVFDFLITGIPVLLIFFFGFNFFAYRNDWIFGILLGCTEAV